MIPHRNKTLRQPATFNALLDSVTLAGTNTIQDNFRVIIYIYIEQQKQQIENEHWHLEQIGKRLFPVVKEARVIAG